MDTLEEIFDSSVRTVCIAGHVNPDGDCVGSCTALYLYIRKNHPEIRADLYLEPFDPFLSFLGGTGQTKSEADPEKKYDLFVSCDTSGRERIGVAGALFENAGRTVCIDHHVTNRGFADINHIEPDASSCAEVLTGLMDLARADAPIAASLYTGIIHDTGVFQYSNTTPRTMRLAAALLEFGIPAHRIIDDSFNRRTFLQNRILGYVLANEELLAEGRIVRASLTNDEMQEFGVTRRDLSMIVSQMRLVDGVEAAVFAYETEKPGVFKVSLRSNEYLDVASVAAVFGGGGHARAAGLTLAGTPDSVTRSVSDEIAGRLRGGSDG